MFRAILIAALALGVFYIGFRAGQPAPTYRMVQIAELVRQPYEFEGRQVMVGGTVGANAAIMGVGGYVLRQDGAEILVLGYRGIPSAGSEISVSGVFRQAVAINGFQYAVILQD